MNVAFLFDNDGVLMDTSELHWLSWQLLMKEEKRLQMSEEMFIHGFGKRNDLILKEIAPEVSQKERDDWALRKEALFREYAKDRLTLLPGMETFLKEVKAANVPRIIASSTPIENLRLFLRATPLGNYFDGFISAEEVAHGKPFPDIFIAAAERLHFPPERCIVIEDSPAGIRAGKEAGCFVVALETTHRKEELSDYDICYPSARELHLPEVLSAFEKKVDG